jgi:hypothetical protein
VAMFSFFFPRLSNEIRKFLLRRANILPANFLGSLACHLPLSLGSRDVPWYFVSENNSYVSLQAVEIHRR